MSFLFFPLASAISYDWEEKHKMLLGLVKQRNHSHSPLHPLPPKKTPKTPNQKPTQKEKHTRKRSDIYQDPSLQGNLQNVSNKSPSLFKYHFYVHESDCHLAGQCSQTSFYLH